VGEIALIAFLVSICCGFVAQSRLGYLSFESSVIAEVHEQTHSPPLQDYELARTQRRAQAPGVVDDLV
jgi:hypothetical protein